MKVLSISTDRKMFEDGSQVFLRHLGYAGKMEEMHIIVFTLKRERHQFKQVGNLYIYPTNSLSEWLYVTDALSLGKSILKSKKISTISTQDPFQTGYVGARLAKLFNLPLQVQVHTDFLSEKFRSSLFNKIRVYIANYVIPRANGVRVVNDVIKNSIKSKFSNIKINIDMLPVYVDIEKVINQTPTFDLLTKFPQFNFIVLMASRLTTEKRISDAIYAFREVVSNFPLSGLVIAGDGPEKSKLEKLVNKLGLNKSVVFVGWQNELVSFYKTSNAFLLTSEYEGYGMTLVEAAASGCPIVTTNVGLAKTGLFKNGENSFVCSVGDISCISSSISELISNNAKRQLFKNTMQDSISNAGYSREEYEARYVGLLEKLTI